VRSGKMNDNDLESLEFFVDEYYIPEVVASLSKICRLKADDLRGTDKEVANKFDMYSDILNKAHAEIDTVN
jgi:hypothetical protein